MSRLIVPWGAAAVLAVIGVAEIILEGSSAGAPAAPAAALAAVVLGAVVAGPFPVTGTAIVALAFPIAVVGGLNGPTGATVLAFFLAPGWAGYGTATARGETPGSGGSGSRRDALAAARRSWPAPLAAQLMASLGTWIAGRTAGSTVSGLAAMAWENLFFGLLCWGAWGVGLLVRRLRDRADLLARLAAAQEAEREAREHAVVVEERQRIARDMHDAVAHSISVMVLQLGAVRTTLPAGTPQTEMLLGVERLGRESVQELRTLVGMLRDATSVAASQPTLTRAEDLVAEVRAAGLPVELTTDGDFTGLPRAVDISAYRVLQEALTNVLRHAGTVPTIVTLRNTAENVTVTVDNDRGGERAATTPGHGLTGMRERVAVFDGSLRAGPRPDGGFTVHAVFPTGSRP
ncbi:sensor histidine kinase [Sphaerisporangium perillae]|uniref:sensor histidine kinase n=1 Tax=Sphaerisporangium perillae TaxID=2935860 RepID=UPI00200F7711|nr:histidine kinase [Sphaerisporangium perillae]